MKRSEREAKEKLKNYDIHTDKRGSSGSMDPDKGAWESHRGKSTSLQNIKDAINTLRQGR